MRPSFRDHALVLRQYDFGEADRVIHLLTREHGAVRAVAKGVRSRSRRFVALAPFVVLDVQIYEGRNLGSLTAADSVHNVASAIVADYTRYTAGCTVLAVAALMAQTESTEELFDLTEAALVDIAGGGEGLPPTTRLDQYMLDVEHLEGWAPEFFSCTICGEDGPHELFSPASGGAVCESCRPSGTRRVRPETLRMGWWLAHHRDASVTQAIAAAEAAGNTADVHAILHEVHEVVLLHLQWHTGSVVRAAQFVEEGD